MALPSSFVMVRPVVARNVSLSLALTGGAPVESLTLTELTNGLAFSAGENATLTLYAKLLPAPAPTLAPVAENVPLPELPLMVPHVALPVATHVGTPVNVTPLGRLSVTLTPLESDRPVLPTCTTYVAVPPGV